MPNRSQQVFCIPRPLPSSCLASLPLTADDTQDRPARSHGVTFSQLSDGSPVALRWLSGGSPVAL
eukprot:8309234-Alexandrium_andersonii.AAC.1